MQDINYDFINNLYSEWYSEQDIFTKNKIKTDIKSKISPYELLMYSAKLSSTYETFLDIYSLNDLLETLKEMEQRGEDISSFTCKPLVISGIENIQTLSAYSRKDNTPSELSNISLKFIGKDIFDYGDTRSISKKFNYLSVKGIDLETIEEMIKSKKDFKDIPIIITIDNVGQLPIDKLEIIQEYFNVSGIKVISKEKQKKSHQGEGFPLNVKGYKQIRTIIDKDIIEKLYITPSDNKMQTDYQLSSQILYLIVNKIQYDFEAERTPRFSKESINASSLVALTTGKAICKGYSEILRNVLSCVNIDSIVIDGNDALHSWNQIKLGDNWFNADLTFASKQIGEGKISGDLFMSDDLFFGSRRNVLLEEINKGISSNSNVTVGGHCYDYGENDNKCSKYISPTLTATLIEKAKSYDEIYKREGKLPEYKGPIPYIGSGMEKNCLVISNIEEIEH